MIRPQIAPDMADLVLAVWTEQAPDATFAGMTLVEFQKAIAPSTDKREELLSLKAQCRAKQEERDVADENTRLLVQSVVAAIRFDKAQGPDSPLLVALGYVTPRNRKARAAKAPEATTTAVAQAKVA